MKFKIVLLFVLILVLQMLLTGCAQPSDAEETDEVSYLELSAVYESEGYVVDLAVTENYVYAAEDEGGFSIFDTRTDTLCSRTRGYQVDVTAYHFSNIKLLAVDEQSDGLMAYNKYGSNAGVHVFNISDKSDPQWQYIHTGNSGDISDLHAEAYDETSFRFYWINGESQYYTGKFAQYPGGTGWYILPEVDKSFEYDVLQVDVNLDAETGTGAVYCASKQLGMKIVSYPAFETIGTVGSIGQTIAVKVVDNIAYLGNREEGIEVYNIADLENQEKLFSYDTTGLASEIAVSDELGVFAVASTSGGIYLFRNSDGEIERLARIDDSEIGYTYAVAICGNYLYAGTRYGIYKYMILSN